MTRSEPEGSGRGSRARSPLAFASLGFELLGPIVLLAYVGHRLDRWLDTRPGFLAGGLVLGIVVSLVGFFRRVWPSKGNGGGAGS